MNIVDHKVEGCWRGGSPNISGALVEPSLLILHFTASGGDGPEGDTAYFLSAAARASAHVIVGRNGHVAQVVPFNRVAWHAGKSKWRGVSGCNFYAIGVEIDNWGALARSPDGRFLSWTGKAVPAEKVALLRHKHERAARHWEVYGEAQLDALERLIIAILAAYPSIREVVGHDDVAPGRKTDPGPAFPMARFAQLANKRVIPAEAT
jgi:N-acetylmuramoyl-L-alanine amidase